MPPDRQLGSVRRQKPFSLIPEVLPAIARFPVASPGLSGGSGRCLPCVNRTQGASVCAGRGRGGSGQPWISWAVKAMINSGMSAMNCHVSLENDWKADGIVFSPSRDSARAHARPSSH